MKFSSDRMHYVFLEEYSKLCWRRFSLAAILPVLATATCVIGRHCSVGYPHSNFKKQIREYHLHLKKPLQCRYHQLSTRGRCTQVSTTYCCFHPWTFCSQRIRRHSYTRHLVHIQECCWFDRSHFPSMYERRKEFSEVFFYCFPNKVIRLQSDDQIGSHTAIPSKSLESTDYIEGIFIADLWPPGNNWITGACHTLWRPLRSYSENGRKQ